MNFLVFDTETQKGKAFLICTSDGKEEQDFVIKNKQDVIKFFVWLHANCKTGFCFNLEYDISALLKYFGKQAVLDLYVDRPITFEHEGNKYEMFGFIRKFIKISKLKERKNVSERKIQFKNNVNNSAGRHSYPNTEKGMSNDNAGYKYSRQTTFFYDVSQYYEHEKSLHRASKRYLGEGKDDVPDKWKKNMLKYFNNPSYKNKIIKYCRKDSNLTHRLSAHFLKMLVETGVIQEDRINKARYYSSGYIAKKYIGKNAKIMPLYDEQINSFMQKFCFGGRIEVFKRGYFPKVDLIDQNSAYGSGLSGLKYITGYNFSTRPASGVEYFFADVEFELPESYVLPVPVKFKNWKYPYGKGRALIDRRTFENVQKVGKILKVHNCLNIYTDEHYPFRKIVNHLYKQRQKSPAHKFIFKNLINSYIGKLNEKVKYKVWVEDEDEQEKYIEMLGNWRHVELEFENEIKNCGCGCYEKERIDIHCKCKTCVTFRNRNKKYVEPPPLYWLGDKMFYTKEVLKYKTHSIYNALVVSGIRNAIYEQGLTLGDSLVGFYIDAIFSTKPISESSDKLGGFSKKYSDWLYLIGAGTYETAPEIYLNKDGSTEELSGTKIRGYRSNISLVEYANKFKNKTVMEVPSLERIGMARVVGGVKSFSEFNELKEKEKYINVNFDANRIWERQFENYKESLKGSINSHPIKL